MGSEKTVKSESRKPYSGKGVSIFSRNFQRRRLDLGLSQAALGEKLDMAASRISEIEAGRFPSSPEKLVAIADALTCSIDSLCGREPLPSLTKKEVKNRVIREKAELVRYEKSTAGWDEGPAEYFIPDSDDEDPEDPNDNL